MTIPTPMIDRAVSGENVMSWSTDEQLALLNEVADDLFDCSHASEYIFKAVPKKFVSIIDITTCDMAEILMSYGCRIREHAFEEDVMLIDFL